jgi:hypothetical protein
MPRASIALIFGLLTPLMAQTGSIRFRVNDPTGVALDTAKATLLGPNESSIRTEKANKQFDIVFAGLPLGEHHFLLSDEGFLPRRLTVNVPNGDEARIEVTLQVDLSKIEILTFSEEIRAQTGSVRFRVNDQSGATIATANATLLGSNESPIRKAEANEKLDIVLASLPLGEHRVLLAAQGFYSKSLTVNIQNSDEVRVETSLEVVPWPIGVDTVSPEPVAVPSPSPPKRRWWHIFR